REKIRSRYSSAIFELRAGDWKPKEWGWDCTSASISSSSMEAESAWRVSPARAALSGFRCPSLDLSQAIRMGDGVCGGGRAPRAASLSQLSYGGLRHGQLYAWGMLAYRLQRTATCH